MGLFGWGDSDETTPEERASWKARAEEQIADQNGDRDEQDKPETRHRRARRPQ